MWQRSSRSWSSAGAGPGVVLGSAGLTDRSRQFFRQRDVVADSVGESTVESFRNQKLARLEAVLLVADSALSARRLAHLAVLASPAEASQLLERLNQTYDAGGSAFHVERVATGFQLLTRPEFAVWLDRLHNRQLQLKLSTPALETLSIVAYRQPITRADIEAIRGVQSTDILRHVMERGLVRIGGEEDSLGRPFLYETTRRFLELFGLTDLDELPNAVLLRRSPERLGKDEMAEESVEDEEAVDEEAVDEEAVDEEDEDEEDDW